MALTPILKDGSETGATVADKVNEGFTQTDENTDAITELQETNILQFTPQLLPVPYQQGKQYYDGIEQAMKIQGPFPDVEVSIGHDLHIHVINNSGVLIEKGSAVRNAGVDAGIPQIAKAIATSFANATVFGIAAHEIPDGEKGAIVTFGEINNTNTSGLTVGLPLYLSDTIAGTYVEIPPDIASQIGGSLLQGGTNGRLFVSIINNITIPTVLGLLQGQLGTGIYNLIATSQNIMDYDIEGSVVMIVDKTNGTIMIPFAGFYDGSFTASLSFTSLASTRTIFIEIYNQTAASVIFTFPFNVPRDATTAGISFSSKFLANENDVFVMRIRSTPDMTVTIGDIDMDINSVRI